MHIGILPWFFPGAAGLQEWRAAELQGCRAWPLRALAMKLKDLEGAIQQITTFQDPDYRLEQ